MPKRFYAILLSVVLTFSMSSCFPVSYVDETNSNVSEQPTYAEEILFCDIPWGSNPDTANENMGGGMFLFQNMHIRYAKNADTLMAFHTEYPSGHYLTDTFDREVSGYPVSQTFLYFMYSYDSSINRDTETSELYMAQYQFDVEDNSAAYIDLKSKLDRLYGPGEEDTGTFENTMVSFGDGYSGRYETYKKVTTWTGENNTQVVLACSEVQEGVDNPFNDFLLLTYTKADCDQRLDSLQDFISQENAEKEEQNRYPENTEGL